MSISNVIWDVCGGCDGTGLQRGGKVCEGCFGSGEGMDLVDPTAAELAAWLADRPELWAELQDAMRTATGGPLPSSDCVGGGR